jgi:hypothetical protein
MRFAAFEGSPNAQKIAQQTPPKATNSVIWHWFQFHKVFFPISLVLRRALDVRHCTRMSSGRIIVPHSSRSKARFFRVVSTPSHPSLCLRFQRLATKTASSASM